MVKGKGMCLQDVVVVEGIPSLTGCWTGCFSSSNTAGYGAYALCQAGGANMQARRTMGF